MKFLGHALRHHVADHVAHAHLPLPHLVRYNIREDQMPSLRLLFTVQAWGQDRQQKHRRHVLKRDSSSIVPAHRHHHLPIAVLSCLVAGVTQNGWIRVA